MRISGLFHGGRATKGITPTGGILTGLLQLDEVSTNPLSAVTKSFVDSALTNLNASNITSGTISANRLPYYTGDLTSSGSSTNLLLKNQAVLGGYVPGIYTKVNVNSKGIVVAVSALSNEDLPELSFTKISSGKPTTLAGYGITDGLTPAGGVMTGYLSMTATPTEAKHVVTKGYIDALPPQGGVATGTIITHASINTPNGFLRLNGAQVSKTTYSNLYSIVGDVVSTRMLPGNGQPWKQQSQINTTQSGDITGWTAGPSLPSALGKYSVIVTKNRVYVLGGFTGSASVSTVYTATINGDGTLAAWSTGTSLPTTLAGASVFITKNRVYLCGGDTGSSTISTVYTAVVNSDGTLGSWTTSAASLPGPLSNSNVVVTSNRVYLISGYTGSAYTKAVYSTTINADGTINAWATEAVTPSFPSVFGQCLVTKNRVYLIGGYNGSSYNNWVYSALINADGTLGTWSAGTALPMTNMGFANGFITKDRAYLLAGRYNLAYSSASYSAPVNSDGTIGAWVAITAAVSLSDGGAIVVKNKVHIIAGRNASFQSATYYATISGGLSDYSSYYDGSIILTDSDKFTLPNTTSTDMFGVYSFIKY